MLRKRLQNKCAPADVGPIVGDIPKVLVRLYPVLPTPQWLLGKQKLVVARWEGASGS
jgi:hypothetical protein